MLVLLLEDDITEIEKLKMQIPWKLHGIHEIITVYSVDDAIEKYDAAHPDLLICDIQVLRGTGIDFLRYVREKGDHTRCIFLTNYSDFSYAKEALRLKNCSYILKSDPIQELEKLIQETIAEINIEKSRKEMTDTQKRTLFRHFFLSVFRSEGELTEEMIRQLMEQHNITVKIDEKYVPVLFRYVSEDYENMVQITNVPFILSNVGCEIFEDEGCLYNFMWHDSERMDIVFVVPGRICPNNYMVNLTERCTKIMQFVGNHLTGTIRCVIGSLIPLTEGRELLRHMIKFLENNVYVTNLPTVYREKTMISKYFDIAECKERWSEMLAEYNLEALLLDVRNFMDNAYQENAMNEEFLFRFYYDYQQIVYSVLEENHIQSSMLFNSSTSKSICKNAMNSVSDMMKFVEHISGQSIVRIREIYEKENVSKKAKSYIEKHYAEHLTRKTIADSLCMNADYLSRVFNKEEGMSMPDYLNEVRMKHARMLLKNGKSVSEAALEVGIDNFSYFSTLYRKFFGISPSTEKGSS